MSMIEDDLGKQIDRSVVTKITLLDIAMNSTHDAQEFNEMLHEYCTILYEYDLWENIHRGCRRNRILRVRR